MRGNETFGTEKNYYIFRPSITDGFNEFLNQNNPKRSRFYPSEIERIASGTGSEIVNRNVYFVFTVDIIPNDIKSVATKLNELRSCAGFNITELAKILHVKRPTIYEWLKSGNLPNLANQERLDKIHSMLSMVIENKLTELKDYLYQKFEENHSLFNLLCQSNLDEKLIQAKISRIEKTVYAMRKKESEHEIMLQREGFKPIDKSQKNKKLQRLIRRIG